MECIADVKATLGEGPVWAAREQALYWLDIPERRLFRWAEGEEGAVGNVQMVALDQHVCCLLPREAGGFIGSGHDGLLLLDEDFTIEVLADPEPDLPRNRFNDGKIDRAGRLWTGTMDQAEENTTGSLYRIDTDLRWHRIDGGYHVTNGPAFSVDGRTMFHTDSARQTVYAFDLDEEGNVSNRRVHLRFNEGDGYPDGMTVDAEDCLWIAFWDGWCVRRFAPDGEQLAELPVPVQRPTSVAFGGANLDQLFVTSARRDLSEAELARQPLAGGLFMCRPGPRGVAERTFAG